MIMMRCAVKFGYDGTGFSGYARQPDQKTVEGEIIRYLIQEEIIADEKSARFQSASRTDKGVSAVCNVVAFDTPWEKRAILGALNAKCDDIWFYGSKEVEDSFNPRYANERWYRYILQNENLDLQKIYKAKSMFVGEHDFRNYAKPEGRNPVRKIDSIEILKKEHHVLIDVKAESFIWNMVRRIVKALEEIGLGNISLNELEKSIDTEEKFDFGLSSPEPLVLMDIAYDFNFDVNRTIIKNLRKIIEKKILTLDRRTELLNQFLQVID
jgi:tRNA pseudouridine38-40 synthase